MHSAIAVANAFIARSIADRTRSLSPTKLHELVYLAHGWHLALTAQPLITGAVVAYRDGVMVPELRAQGCWGTHRAEELLSVFNPSTTSSGMIRSYVPQVPKDDPAQNTLAWVWNTYRNLTPYELTNLTRQAGSPWDKIWHHPQRVRDEPYDIPSPLMRKWFGAEVKMHQYMQSRDPAGAAPAAAPAAGGDTPAHAGQPEHLSLRNV